MMWKSLRSCIRTIQIVIHICNEGILYASRIALSTTYVYDIFTDFD